MLDLGDCNVERMSLKKLSPAEYNPRKISDSAKSGLGHSIQKFGILVPIIWNERTGNIVGGHQRYTYLLESGVEETDVIVVDLDEKEEVALNITLNNKFAQGDFTDDISSLLSASKIELGSLFCQLKLDELQDSLKKKSSYNDNFKGNEPKDPVDPKEENFEESSKVYIVCPSCNSSWSIKGQIIKDESNKL